MTFFVPDSNRDHHTGSLSQRTESLAISSAVPLGAQYGQESMIEDVTPEGHVLPEQDDWAHSTREALNTMPRVWSRSLLYALIAFAAIGIPWAMICKIDEVSTATGRLEPKGQTIQLDAPMLGTVETVHVKEGQQVTQGQPLIAFETDKIEADLQQAEKKLEGLKNRITQLELGKNQIQVSIRLQKQQYQAQLAEQQAQLMQTRQRLDFNQAAIDSAAALILKDRDQVERLQRLESEGVVSVMQVQDAERHLIENIRQLEQGRSELAQTQSEIEKQKNTYERVVREERVAAAASQKQIQDLRAQITETRTEMGQTESIITALQYQQQQHVLKAPVDGMIFQLPQKNPGAVVQASQTLAQLAPKGAPLQLKATVESRSTGFLSVGLPAKVKLDAYPFQQYGVVPGRITRISPDSRTIQTAGGQQQQVYDIEIELARNYVQNGSDRIVFAPGQAATVEVIVRQRRLIDFVLDPFKQLKEGGLNF